MLNKEEIYKFNVIGTKLIHQGLVIYELALDNDTTNTIYSVKKEIYEKDDFLPAFLYCKFLGYDNWGHVKLEQVKSLLFKEYYEHNKTYDFDVEREVHSSRKGERRFVVSSKFKLQHIYTIHNDESLNVGDKIKLITLFNYSKDGVEYLDFQKTNYELETFEPYNVFQESGHTKDFELYFEGVKDWSVSSEYIISTISDMNEKIKNGNRLWLFDYINTLIAYSRSLDKNELSTVKKISILISDLEKWILEESGLLKSFSNEKREETCLKSEQNRENALCTVEAINILEDNGQSDYLSNVLMKIRKSMYLKDKNHVYKVLYEIIILDTEFVARHIIELSEFISFTSQELSDNYFNEKLTYKLSVYIYNLKKEINQQLHYIRIKEINTENLSKLVIGIGTLLNVLKSNNDLDIKKKRCVLFSDLCKYLSYLTTNDKALLLINKSLLATFLNLDIETINSKVLSESLNDPDLLIDYILNIKIPSSDISLSTIREGIYMKFEKNELYIANFNSYNRNKLSENKFHNIYSILGTGLNIMSSDQTEHWENSDSLLYYKVQWKSFLKENLQKKVQDLQNDIIIETKGMNHEFKNLVFCRRKDTISKEEGVISLSGYSDSFFVDDVREIFTENMHFPAKRIVKPNGRIEYNIKNAIRAYSNDIAGKTTDEIVGLCLNINSQTKEACFITENGILCKSYITNGFSCKMNEAYNLTVDLSIDNESLPIAVIVDKSRKILNKNILLRNQLLGISSFISNPINEYLSDNENFPYIHLILDNYIRLFDDKVIRYNLYQIASLISKAEHSSLHYFYESCIQYMEMFECFSENLSLKDDSEYSLIESEKNQQTFPSLRKYAEMHKILKYFGHDDDLEYLFHISVNNKSDEQLIRFARLSLSASLIASVSDDDRPISYLRSMISSEFNGSVENKDLPYNDASEYEERIDNHERNIKNWGNEGQNLEFKTSIVYLAGDTEHSINLDDQTFIILKVIDGFLNASGGTLLIGIKDDGSVSGIADDLQALNCNIDKYERILRDKIVKFFNKDVNSTIAINFIDIENKTICEMKIPEYIKPISLKSDFYQRQGNEIRIIKGDDLVMFITRKLNGKSTIIMDSSRNDHDNSYNLQNSESEEVIINNISGNAPVPGYAANLNTIFYINFYSDGEYILGEQITGPDIIASLKIDESTHNQYILQCYNNGCINKISIKNILAFQHGFKYKNGINKDSTLNKIMILSNDDYVVIISSQHEIDYIKAMSVSDISAHTSLGLRGNQIISQVYDKVKSWYAVLFKDSSNILKLITCTRTNLGRKVSSPSIANEIEWLKSYIVNKQGNYSSSNIGVQNINTLRPENFKDSKSVSSYFDSFITRGNFIPKARKEAQQLLEECTNSIDFWKIINGLLDCDILVFRKPISEIISTNTNLVSFVPTEKLMDSLVQKLFTFDHKYSQSLDLIYPFKEVISTNSMNYIQNTVKGLNNLEDYQKFFDITQIGNNEKIKFLLLEESISSYFILYRLLFSMYKNDEISKKEIISIRESFSKTNLAGSYIADLINVYILDITPVKIQYNVLAEINRNDLDFFKSFCQVKENKEKEANFILHLDDFRGKIITGKIIKDYQNHYLIRGLHGTNILLQHDWSTIKHFVDDKVTVKIISVYKNYKTMFGTEIDDNLGLPKSLPLLNIGDYVNVSFSDFNGNYIPKLKGSYSKIKVHVINYPNNFNFRKTYRAKVFRNNNLFEFYIRLISVIE